MDVAGDQIPRGALLKTRLHEHCKDGPRRRFGSPTKSPAGSLCLQEKIKGKDPGGTKLRVGAGMWLRLGHHSTKGLISASLDANSPLS